MRRTVCRKCTTSAGIPTSYPTDYQFAQHCNSVPITTANQEWQWKGEWWGYGATMIYSHTQMPNRTSCLYHDIVMDGRGTITMIAASSNHPGGVNVLFMDGSVRFIKNSVNYLTMVCHRDSEQSRSGQFRRLLSRTKRHPATDASRRPDQSLCGRTVRPALVSAVNLP